MIQRYIAKISGLLLDRIDIHIEIPALKYKELRGSAAIEGSAEIHARVLAARERQRLGFHGLPATEQHNQGRQGQPGKPASWFKESHVSTSLSMSSIESQDGLGPTTLALRTASIVS